MTTPRRTARAARGSTAFRRIARAGYVVLGAVHIVIGALAVSVATGGGHDADQGGAMAQIRETPVGGLLLWAIAAGLFALAAWQIVSAFVVADSGDARRWARRAKLLGMAAAYVAVGVTALVFALGGRADSGETTQTLSARVLAAPGGVVLLVAIGLGVVAVGAGFVVGAFTTAFTKTMELPEHGGRRGVIALGVVGYLAKGVAVAATGLLFVVAAWTHDPEKAAGLDGALRSLAALPFGRLILWGVGLGLAVYGVFCFFRAPLTRM